MMSGDVGWGHRRAQSPFKHARRGDAVQARQTALRSGVPTQPREYVAISVSWCRLRPAAGNRRRASCPRVHLRARLLGFKQGQFRSDRVVIVSG
jgi:hypothetical protein